MVGRYMTKGAQQSTVADIIYASLVTVTFQSTLRAVIGGCCNFNNNS